MSALIGPGAWGASGGTGPVPPDFDYRYYTKTQSDARYYLKGEVANLFAAKDHDHDSRYYTKQVADSTFAALSHEHTAADVTDFAATVNALITALRGAASGLAPLDADGLVPLANLPAGLKESKVVEDLTERDAIADPYEGLICIVLDATPDVAEGGALYVYDGSAWQKIADADSLAAVLDWSNITNKPLSSPEDIDEAVSKALGDTFAEKVHTHDIAQVSGLQAALDDKSDVGHKHTVGDITAEGIASVDTFLRGDGRWAVPPSGGGGGAGGLSRYGTTVTAVPAGGKIYVSHPRDTSFLRFPSASKFVAGSQVTDTTLSFDTGHAAAFDKTNVEFVDGKVRLAEDTEQEPIAAPWAEVTGNTKTAQWITLRLADGPITAQVMRVYMTRNQEPNNGHLNILEVELYDNDGVKISLGSATATASASYPSAPPSYAIDGDVNSRWGTDTDATDKTTGAVLYTPIPGENFVGWQVALPSAQQISRVRLLLGQPGYGNSPKDFLIQFSTDPSASVSSSKNDPAWFGANLINGDAVGNEKTDGEITQATVYPFFPSGLLTTTNSSAVNTGNWDYIKSMALTQATPEDTELRYLFSFDGRETWLAHDGGAWGAVDPLDIATDGMTKSAIEVLTQSDWEQLALAERFDLMVYFGTSDPAKTPELDQVTFTAQGQGTWQALPIGTGTGVDVVMENSQTIFENKTGQTQDLTVAVALGAEP